MRVRRPDFLTPTGGRFVFHFFVRKMKNFECFCFYLHSWLLLTKKIFRTTNLTKIFHFQKKSITKQLISNEKTSFEVDSRDESETKTSETCLEKHFGAI